MSRTLKRVLVGECMVDSGQLMLIDPCYCIDRRSGSQDQLLEENGVTYEGAREITCSGDGAGQLGRLACVTATGYGDGSYPVYADIDEDGRVMAVMVMFGDPTDLPHYRWQALPEEGEEVELT